MSIPQLSVFMENKRGRLHDICKTIGDAGVNIRGFAVADMADYGIFRVIVDDADRASSALRDAGFAVTTSDVVAVAVPDEPGALAGALEALADGGLSVEYMYIIANTRLAFAFDDLGRAASVLAEKGFHVLSPKEL